MNRHPIVWYTYKTMSQSSKVILSRVLLIVLCIVSIGSSFFLFLQSKSGKKETVTTITIDSWKSLNAPAPVALFESQGAVIGKKMYVFGGFHTPDAQATPESFVFDTETNSWSKIADMPEAITHAGTAIDGTTVYFAGGYIGSHPGPVTNHVWKYDTSTDTWGEVSPLPQERTAGVLVIVDKKLHFFGGGIRNQEETNIALDSENHWVLDLNNPTGWEEKAPLPNPRNHFAGVVLNGKIYAIGGQHLEGAAREYVSDLHVYDSKTDTWEKKSSLPFGVSHIGAATFVLEGKIITIGGITEEQQLISSVLSYDPKTDNWEYLTSIPQPLQATVAGVIGNSIYITTGKNNQNILLSETIKGTYKFTDL